LGEGSLVTSMVLCATTIALVDRRFRAAAGWAAAAAALSWTGLMHADRIGWAEAPGCALGYALMALLFVGIGWLRGAEAEASCPGRASRDGARLLEEVSTMSVLFLALLLLADEVPAAMDPAAIPNYTRVRPGLAAAGKPSPSAIAHLKEQGFKTVI